MKPHRESQRPLLPQHARHCPVLEGGSAAGFLVHPPLHPDESVYIGYLGEGRYQFVYYVNPTGSKWEPTFTVTSTLPVGGIGTGREEVQFLTPRQSSREEALLMARVFVVFEDLGTPPGAVTLRGAWNFQTPSGWDSIYTPVFNMIERPIAPMLVIRVETDWYPHDSEFRYVLQPGEGISASHSIPIGQVLFVPREEITVKDCTDEEVAAIAASKIKFAKHKAAEKLTTPYGLQYSPHYLRASRSQPTAPILASASSSPPKPLGLTRAPALPLQTRHASEAGPGSASVPKVGRNDHCPCGSGKKYKKCHGANES